MSHLPSRALTGRRRSFYLCKSRINDTFPAEKRLELGKLIEVSDLVTQAYFNQLNPDVETWGDPPAPV